MTAISAKRRDAMDAHQMMGGARHFTPCGREEVPNMFGRRRRRPGVLGRLFQEHGEPRYKASPIALEQMVPANHIDVRAFSGKRFLDGRVSHQPIRLGEVRQHADREAKAPAQKPADPKGQDFTAHCRADPTVIIAEGLCVHNGDSASAGPPSFGSRLQCRIPDHQRTGK